MDRQMLGRLLIVDDETELMTVLCETLKVQGYETEGFASGKEALERLKEDEFDLLLTDLMMPDMDGIALLKAALEIDPNLVGIIMTGQGTVQTAVEAMKIGAFDYILKPFKLNTLRPIISRAMGVRNLKKENIELRGTLAIYELTKVLSITTDLSVVANKVADAAMEQVCADEVSIMLPIEDDDDELYVAAVRGSGRDRILGQRVKVGHGIAGWVAQHHKLVKLEGEVTDTRFKPVHPRPEINTAVSIPMMAGGKFVGVLNLNAINRRSFTIGQIKALTITVSMAAPSIENARLFEMLQEAEAKYRNIFENAIEGIFQTTPEGLFIVVNPSFARIFGYGSPEELVEHITNIPRQLYVDPDQYLLLMKELEKSDTVIGFETQVCRKDGAIIWVSKNVRIVRNSQGKILHYEGSVEDIADRKRAAEELKETLESLRKSVETTIQVLTMAGETRDPYTAGHQRRTTDLAMAIASEMGLPQHTIEGIRMAGSIHDIGKISIPAEILSKPTKLSELELSFVKSHAQSGYEILKDVESPWPLADIAHQHHERMNGSGYPHGLKGEDILLEARIIAVADVVEAIASHRPYRPALGIDVALDEIEKNAGILYDREVVDVCLKLFREKGFKFE